MSVVATVLLIAGVAIQAISCLGLIVMHNVYDRLHYVGTTGFGALLVAVAVVAEEGFSLIGDKALATAAVLLVCGPVLVHATSRTARIREHGEWTLRPDEEVDEP